MKAYKIITSFLQRFFWLPTRLTFNFFCNLEIIGVDNLNRVDTAIFASNHLSELDPILIAVSLPFSSHHLPLFYTSREKQFYKNKKGWKKFIYGGNIFKAWGAYQVYVGIKNYERSLVNHLEILKDKGSVCIFPEGRRNLKNELIKAKGGVSFLVHKTKLPVIPVLIQGVQCITIYDFLSRKKKIKVTFGKPLYIKDIFKNQKIILNEFQNDYETASAIVMQKIYRLSRTKNLSF